MNEPQIIEHASNILMLVLLLSLPALAISVVVGLIVGLLQAVTQIQDQTLPQAIKLVCVLVLLIAAGPWMLGPLVEQARQVFDAFPTLVR
ncbi:translocation protein [Aliidongia dinghuensis]|uniref:Translocation protein n=1 Tax=Aliidongia dinghuensis TaxID=1867774 RepID=A0A8J2YQL0_9PROT|nr:type III secretion system export apparatus subunit SctS [Aliidongia dinghuensis]GGF05320.1 translocation protein [Aliidongia dinghuensis]